MNFVPFVLLALILTGCTSPDAGRVAARASGGICVEFTRNGRPDTATMLRHDGYWWRYHPRKGSVKTPWKDTEPAPIGVVLAIKGAEGPIRIVSAGSPRPAPLANGCLPTAKFKERVLGGRIVQVSEHHVEHFR